MGGRILIVRHGAFGDMIHVTHLPRMLKENGWDFVGLSTGYKGVQILGSNPFVDTFHTYEPLKDHSAEYYRKRIKILSEDYDKTINLHHSLEVGALALEGQDEYYQSQKVRERLGKGRNYYDIMTVLSGYPELCGKYRGELFYSDKEHEIVKHDLLRPGRFDDKFKVMINLCGSGPHKVFIQAQEVAEAILEKYPDCVILTTAAKWDKELDFENLDDRVHSLVGKKPFRQVLLMAKYMDCVIGCESGLMCGASLWDVPTIQLLTCTDAYNHCKYTTKDYSIQSPAKCSPCYKGPYKYWGCPKRNNLPICVYFNVDDIIKQVDKIYEEQYLLQRRS